MLKFDPDKGEEFFITKLIIKKIKKIKDEPNLFIGKITFNSPPFGTNIKALKKIAGKLIGKQNIKSVRTFGQGGFKTIEILTTVDFTLLVTNKDEILLQKGLVLEVGSPIGKASFKQNIIIPKEQIFELRDEPSNSKVQSIIFNREFWTISKAKDWINKHPQFKIGKIDIPADGKTIRFRQRDPKEFKRFRIKNIGNGNIKLVLGFK